MVSLNRARVGRGVKGTDSVSWCPLTGPSRLQSHSRMSPLCSALSTCEGHQSQILPEWDADEGVWSDVRAWQGASSWPVELPEEKGAGARRPVEQVAKRQASRVVRASQADGASRVHRSPKLECLWQTLAL